MLEMFLGIFRKSGVGGCGEGLTLLGTLGAVEGNDARG